MDPATDPVEGEAERFVTRWRTAILPLWARWGFDAVHGAFHEALDDGFAPVEAPRRLRVTARQTFVFAEAASATGSDVYTELALRGLERILGPHRRPDGLYRNSLHPDGASLDDRARLYEQAFVILAFAACLALRPGEDRIEQAARDLLCGLDRFRGRHGIFLEIDDEPRQSNALMHLFEAALALERSAGWDAASTLADEIGDVAMRILWDEGRGAIVEVFDETWRPVVGGESDRIEPGHQFEWSWLLGAWAMRRGGAPDPLKRAGRLIEVGKAGIDPGRNVVVDRLAPDLSRRPARLWPQAERVHALAATGDLPGLRSALGGLERFFTGAPRGLWRERQGPDGAVLREPTPASSLYHLAGAAAALRLRRGVTGRRTESPSSPF